MLGDVMVCIIMALSFVCSVTDYLYNTADDMLPDRILVVCLSLCMIVMKLF